MAFNNESDLNLFNQQLRANPAYRQFLQSMGVNINTPTWHLSGDQRSRAEQWVNANVRNLGNLQIDPAGNANQDEGFSKYAKDWKTYAIGGGAALGGLGLAGLGPLGFLGGGGAAASPAAGAAGGLIPNSGGALTAGLSGAVPASIASQGVSGALGTAMPAAAGAAGSVTGGLAKNAAEGAGGGVGGFLKGLATPENGAALAALVAGLMSGRGNNQSVDNINRIQNITEAQMRRADPLHQVAVNLAFGRMPTNYREGVQLENMPLPR